jgi:hypothetical protein
MSFGVERVLEAATAAAPVVKVLPEPEEALSEVAVVVAAFPAWWVWADTKLLRRSTGVSMLTGRELEQDTMVMILAVMIKKKMKERAARRDEV